MFNEIQKFRSPTSTIETKLWLPEAKWNLNGIAADESSNSIIVNRDKKQI